MSDRAAQIAALRLPLRDLPDPLPIPTIEKPFDATIRPPGSKSITNRALLLAALADGTSELRGPLIDADDAQVMLAAIQQLGAKVEIKRALSASSGPAAAEALDTLHITGVNGRWKIPPNSTITLNLHNAGTATRFLTAAAVLAPPGTSIIIDGDPRMRERPIGELVAALNQLGVTVSYEGRPGFPPIRIAAPAKLETLSPEVTLDHAASSQFISALMMLGPFLPSGLRVRFIAAPSWPYIEMTQEILAEVGAHAEDEFSEAIFTWSGSRHATGPSGKPGLKAFTIEIEPDASGATYFEASAALIPGARCTIAGLDVHPVSASLQGDTQFITVITEAGAHVERLNNALRVTGAETLNPLNILLEDMPDTAMTAAVLACFASPTATNPTATTTLRGLRTLRVKETDRLAALQTELTKLGAKVEIYDIIGDEGLRITPPTPSLRDSVTPSLPLHFDTYNDHRMAMSLALIGLKRPNVFIRNPACVAKTYPTFWHDLAKLYE